MQGNSRFPARKFRDGVKLLQGSEQLVAYIGVLRNALWPGGQLKPKEPPRTPAQRAYTRDSANRKLSALMPGPYNTFREVGDADSNTLLSDVAANLIGRANARQGARRLFAVIQNRRLNRVSSFRSFSTHSNLTLVCLAFTL